MIPLRIVEPFPDEPEAGMMWRYPREDVPERECWWIVLPHTPEGPGHPTWVSWRTTDRAHAPPHEMWDVTGEPPNITVTPSIDVMRYVNGQRAGSYWHGFITNGAIQ